MHNSKMPPDPSIEEILSSIRRIISEDQRQAGRIEFDEGAGAHSRSNATGNLEAEASELPTVKPSPEIREEVLNLTDVVITDNDTDESVLELTEFIDENTSKSVQPSSLRTSGIHTESVPNEGTQKIARSDASTSPLSSNADVPLVSDATAMLVSSIIAKLMQDAPRGGETRLESADRKLDDLVRGLMRPMLSEWLDKNLPQIVEQTVARELSKLIRKKDDV